MTWKVVFRPEVEADMVEAISWYEQRQPGLGLRFAEEIAHVWDALAENPRLNARRHPTKNLRWRYPVHFPYRVVFEVFEEREEVVVLAVSHAARLPNHWKSRQTRNR